MSYFRENIERLEGYVPGYQPAGGEVVKLNTNENPYPPSPKVIEAIRNVVHEQLRRYPQPLGDAFRRAAGKVLGVGPECIMCVNGGDELLSMCFRAFCDEGHPVAYPEPTYSLYPVLAGVQNCRTIEVPVGEDDFIGRLGGAGGALTILCNPNAPTGAFIPVEEVARLAEAVEGILLVDEAYVDFAPDSCIGLVERYGNVILLRSMSKGYSLAGLRFGFGIAQSELIAGMLKVKDSYNVDVIAIAAACVAIEDQQYFRANVEKIKTARTELTEKLRRLGFEVPESFSNFVLAGHRRAKEIYNKLTERDIYVRYFRLAGLEDKLRITIGTQGQNGRLIEALAGIV